MDRSKYVMKSLNEFVNETYERHRKPNSEITNKDRLDAIIEEFGIEPDELYYESLRDAVYKMAKEIYFNRGRKYVDSGWVNPN